MALSVELEALVKELEKVDPAGAKAQRDLLEKHASLQKGIQEGVLRQSEFDRKFNEVKPKIEGYDKAVKDRDEWSTWYKENKPRHDETIEENRRLLTKVSTLEADIQARIDAAAAVNNDDPANPKVDAGKIADAVRERMKSEYVSSADLTRIVAEETKKSTDAARDAFFSDTFPKAALFITEMSDAQLMHFQETGKLLPREEFAKYLKDNGIASPRDGYQKFMEPARKEKEIEEKVKTRLNEEMEKRNNSGEFPGSSGAPQPMGTLQVRLAKREEGDPLIPKDSELGDGAAAMAAAAELRKGS